MQELAPNPSLPSRPNLSGLWSLWDLLKSKIGKLLELHERLVIEKGFFERAAGELANVKGAGQLRVPMEQIRTLKNAVVEIEHIAAEAKFSSTLAAAVRTKQVLSKIPDLNGTQQSLLMEPQHCATMFHHLMDICSRIRDDCESRIYFQISSENAKFLDMNADHFGKEVRTAFGGASGDIAEAASCLALERWTASVFHLMRALELAVQTIANKIGATIEDEHGKVLPWGVIAQNMKPIIDKMPKGSPEQIKWYKVQAFLETVNRAWRTPTAHPKQTYTPEEARNVFEATKAFMQELAPLAA
jgi:hypothetical protein